MKAALLTVGDELLLGHTVNTDAAWLGEQLDELGLEVVRVMVVSDREAAIRSALQEAFEAADLVIVTGGLGPTHDDVTREAVAAFSGRELAFDEAVHARIEERFARRGRPLPASNRAQAMVPDGFAVLPNPRGTAPGLWHECAANGRRQFLVVLPGVPDEMEELFRAEVHPRLQAQDSRRIARHRVLRTTGIGESNLHEKVGDASALVDGDALRLAYLPQPSGVRLHLSAYGDDLEEVEHKLDQLERRLRDRIDPYIYGTGEEELPTVIGRMLRERNLTVALAESCTGGYVINQFTNVSGSSAYVLGGVVAYSNATKRDLLDVNERALRAEGAVSEEVACQMAAGARRCLEADIGLSTTGIAGPTGGTPDKPVGTVWIGYADADGAEARLLHLREERLLNKALTSAAVFDLVRTRL